MFRSAGARVLRPPLSAQRAWARRHVSSAPQAKPDSTPEAESAASTAGSAPHPPPPTASPFPDLDALKNDTPPTAQETEDKIKAYVASLTEVPIALGPPTTIAEPEPEPLPESASKVTDPEHPPRAEASAETSTAPTDTSDFAFTSSDGVSDADTTSSTSASTRTTATPSSTGPKSPSSPPSSDFASFQPPSQEEWEQKYAELRDAYYARMSSLRAATERRTRDALQAAAVAVSVVGLKVNEATGYREVERLKAAVKEREQEISAHRAAVKAAKQAYEEAVAHLSSTQSNVNSLLERKHSWSDADVARFTQLVRADHASRAAVASTSEELKAAEGSVDRSFSALMQAILERYHEEQVWSDKIRSVSTWAQIAALVANLVVFVGAIAFIEPWKRRRLVEGLEERVAGMMDRVEGEIRVLGGSVAALAAERGLERGVKGEGEGLPEEYMPAELAEVTTLPGGEGVADTIPESVEVVAGDGDEYVDVAGPTTPEPIVESILPPATPLDALAAASPESTKQALRWVNEQLGHIAPPSPERDLGAVAVAGALGGVLVVGLATAIRSIAKG